MVRRFFRQFGMRKEAKHSETVVDCKRDDALARHTLALVSRFRAVTCDETAAVEIDEYRQALASGFRGSPDIQVETVFTHAIRSETHVSEDLSLHATRAELIRLAHILPVLDRLRRLPAQVADGWSGERDSLEGANSGAPGVLVGGPFDETIGGLDAILRRCAV